MDTMDGPVAEGAAAGGASPGVAFALVVGAGLATVVGAVIALFCPKADPRFLGLGLGLSAGVMIYISFVEIFSIKAVEGFEDAGHTREEAKRYSTLLFFGGMLITFLLDVLVHLLGFDHGFKFDQDGSNGVCKDAGYSVNLWLRRRCAGGSRCFGGCFGGRRDPRPEEPGAGPLPEGKGRGLAGAPPAGDEAEGSAAPSTSASSPASSTVGGEPRGGSPGEGAAAAEVAVTLPAPGCPAARLAISAGGGEKPGKDLQKMGIMTAVAIGIHNFPEGLATFVAALADTSLGVAIAVAIAIHNVPEGLCVALPIYYSTGSRWRATLWAFLSGVSEPIGGLIGWIVFANSDLHPLAYGVMFSLVAGMMVFISLHELLPTALSYDPKNQFVTYAMVGGMVIMALSLLLFDI